MEYYCLFIKHGEEEKFKKEAQKRVSQTAPECKFYFFTEDAWQGRAKYGHKVRRAAFPGYVFMTIENLSGQEIQTVKKIKGFIRFLPSNDNILKIDGPGSEELKRFIEIGEHHKMSTAVYSEGDRVRITGGDIKDLEAYIVGFDLRHQSVKIRLPNQWISWEFHLSYEILMEKIPDQKEKMSCLD